VGRLFLARSKFLIASQVELTLSVKSSADLVDVRQLRQYNLVIEFLLFALKARSIQFVRHVPIPALTVSA